MEIDELCLRIRSVLGSPMHGSPGVRVFLRSIDDLGFQPLRNLVGLLAPDPSAPLVVGFYSFGFDTAPHRLFGEPKGQIELVKDTELDWRLWTATVQDLSHLEAAIS